MMRHRFLLAATAALAALALVSCPQPFEGRYLSQANDGLSPTIAITSPRSSDSYLEEVTVVGAVSDSSADGDAGEVRSVTYTVTTTLESSDPEPVTIQPDGEFSFSFSTLGFTGDIIVTVTVVDWNDNEESASITLTDPGNGVPSLTATAGNGTVTLEWNAVDSVVGYDVRYAATIDGRAVAGEATDITPPHALTGLENGARYDITVVGTTSDDREVRSATLSAIPLSAYTLAPSVTETPDGLLVTWEAIDGADTFTIYRSDRRDAPAEELATVSINAFEDTGVAPGTAAYYSVSPALDGATISAAAGVVRSELPARTFAVEGRLSRNGNLADLLVDEQGDLYLLEDVTDPTPASNILSIDASDLSQPQVRSIAGAAVQATAMDKHGDAFALAVTSFANDPSGSDPNPGVHVMRETTGGLPDFVTLDAGSLEYPAITSGPFDVALSADHAYLGAGTSDDSIPTFYVSEVTSLTAETTSPKVLSVGASPEAKRVILESDLLALGVVSSTGGVPPLQEHIVTFDATAPTASAASVADGPTGASGDPHALVLEGSTISMMGDFSWQEAAVSGSSVPGSTTTVVDGTSYRDLTPISGGLRVATDDAARFVQLILETGDPIPLGSRLAFTSGTDPAKAALRGDDVFVMQKTQGLRTLSLEHVVMPVTVDTIASGDAFEAVTASGDQVFAATATATAGTLYSYTVGPTGQLTQQSAQPLDDLPVMLETHADLLFVGTVSSSSPDVTLAIMSVADAAPQPLADIALTASPSAIAAVGDVIYVAGDGLGLAAYDISNPESPSLLDTESSYTRLDRLVAAGPGRLVGQDENSGRIVVYDVTDPAELVVDFTSDAKGYTDVVYRGDDLLYNSYSVSGTGIVDASSIANGTHQNLNGEFNDDYTIEKLALVGNSLIMMDPIGTLRRADVSDETAPVTVGYLDLGEPIRSFATAGTYAYVLSDAGSLIVVDLNPAP